MVEGSAEALEDQQDEKKSIGNKGTFMRKLMGNGHEGERDPNNLNPQLQIMWDDIVGEPDGLDTPTGCWNCSHKCYHFTRECCYITLAVLFGPFIAFFSGITFACLSFHQVWCVGPCLRQWKINCVTCRKFWETCLMAICAPCAEVFGLYFSKIKIRYQKLPDGDTQTTEDYFNV